MVNGLATTNIGTSRPGREAPMSKPLRRANYDRKLARRARTPRGHLLRHLQHDVAEKRPLRLLSAWAGRGSSLQ